MSFGAIRRLADLVLHIGAYGPTAISPPSDPEQFSMESSREITTDDMAKMYPGLFVEN